MSLANTGFESGSSGGVATSWTWSNVAGGATSDPVVMPDTAVPAQYDGGVEPFEDFENGWGNDPPLFSSFNSIAALYEDGSSTESFENGWGNDPSYTYPDQPVLAFTKNSQRMAAQYGGTVDGTETFNTGWNNEGWTDVLGAVTSAVYSGLFADNTETFEHVFPVTQYTADATNDRIDFTPSTPNFAANVRIVLDAPIAGVMPSPLVEGLPYYVQNVVSTSRFKLALASGAGSPIDITTVGSGILKARAPYEYWDELLT